MQQQQQCCTLLAERTVLHSCGSYLLSGPFHQFHLTHLAFRWCLVISTTPVFLKRNLCFKSFLGYKLKHGTRAALWILAKGGSCLSQLGQASADAGWRLAYVSSCHFPGTCRNYHCRLSTVLSPLPFLWWRTLSPLALDGKTQVCPCWGETGDPVSNQWAQSGTALQQRLQVAEKVCCEVLCHGEQFQMSLYPVILRVSFYTF